MNESLQFRFDPNQFNRLFPFYILVDEQLKIISVGQSLKKVSSAKVGERFSRYFEVQRPAVHLVSLKQISEVCNQLVIIKSSGRSDLILRGQFEYSERDKQGLFVGTPWFGSMDQVRANKLSLHDFAYHDPMIDLLHVLKTSEITNDEIKHLLKTVNDQKNKIKNSESNYRSIVEKATDIIYKVDHEGNFRFVNKVAERITGYPKEELLAMNYTKLIREDFREKAASLYIHQFENRIPTTYFEFPIITKKGKEVWIGQSVQLHLNSKSEIELTALAIDISERKQAEMNVLLQEEKYRNIIANMNLGLLEVDMDDRIQFANQSFCLISGYELPELKGKKASDIFMSDEGKQIISKKNRTRIEGASDVYSLPVKNKKGEQRWWVISGAPRYNDNGEIVGSVGIHLDVTEQKSLEEELKIAKLKAEESSKAKESFLATMSHEIRTPLNAIIGITDLMQISNDARNDQNLDILSFSAKNLLALISDILDISKIDAGKIELVRNPMNMHKVVHSICQAFKPALEEKKVKLDVTIGSEVPEILIGDELRFSQILNNLLSNAVKFTCKGSVSVLMNTEILDDKKVRLTCAVTDSGIGIATNKLKTIFEAFEQADNKIVRQFGGTGLGLNITKKLIELQGGIIQVSSKLKRGTTFKFTLDLDKGMNTGKVSAKNDQTGEFDSALAAGKTVLLVEDKLANQKVAISYLNHWGVCYEIANNGVEALEILKTKQFDAALIDLFMPEMDGFETMKRIRKNKKLTGLPLIALTASAEVTLMNKALECGADRCLTKPFNPQILKSTLFGLMKIPMINYGEICEISQPVKRIIKFKYIDLSTLQQASLGSEAFVKEMLVMLAKEIPEMIAESENLLKMKEMELFSKVIHKLKSNLLTLGIEVLRNDLIFMEEQSRHGLSQEEVHSTFYKMLEMWAKAKTELDRVVMQ
ncbi:MAG: PAS domain S-box protein [Bacteroidetes bacterium]|nr:PAS domain S-box protein [Bacteroidota bacterium]